MNRHELNRRTLAVIMAGGNGHRLGDLTRWHSKPALPFGGHYRNIDFTLSNCLNSGIRRIGLLTQYKAHSLIQHVHQGWSFLRPDMGEFVELWPAQQRLGQSWYAGTAGDHIYKMSYLTMIAAHVAKGADVTVGCAEVPLSAAPEFGVMRSDRNGRVREFSEKPADPAPIPGQTQLALASMGIYVFNRDFLVQRLVADANNPGSNHDFGRDILPGVIESYHVHAHAFRNPRTGGQAYWRDVGTIDSYWDANMELLGDAPGIDLHDDDWPVWTHHAQCPPTLFKADGVAIGSIVAAGCVVAGTVRHSLMFTNSQVGEGSRIEDSLILPGARIGRRCRVKRAIVESGCTVPDNTVIGDNLLDDTQRCYVSPKGVVLVTSDSLDVSAARRAARAVA
jgi:glucose-1-phosphate adenylyltransferase